MKIRNNGSRIFLTELIFSIFFFIVISAICVQCFAAAFAKSKESEVLTGAINVASNMADRYLGGDKFTQQTEYYDENWQPDEKNWEFKSTGIITEKDIDNNCETMHIIVSNEKDEIIYSLDVKKAVQ